MYDHKNDINQELVELIPNGLKRKPALILESPQLNTITELRRQKFKGIIDVPNHIEHLSITDKKVNYQQIPVGQMVKETSNKYGFVWLDYCCHLLGNKKIKPIKDMDTIFKRKLLLQDGVFAVTFSRRSPNGWKNGKEWNKTFKTIFDLSQKYGYNLDPIAGEYYKKLRNMYYIVYKVVKNDKHKP